MLYTRFLLLFSLVLTLDSTLPGQALFRKPLKVLGDPQYLGTASNPTAFTNTGPNLVEGREFSFAAGIALDTSVNPPIVYVADAGNHRVLGFQYATQLKAGSTADVVIGQVDRFGNLTSTQNGRATTGLNTPTGLAVDASGNLYIADTGNNRIVRYPKPLAQPGGQEFPDLVIGQTSFSGRTANAGGISATSLFLSVGGFTRTGIALDASGNLWVSDTGNIRVLRFPAASLKANQNAPTADLVVGQTDFVSHVQATSVMAKTGLIEPQGLTFDPAGRLLVADTTNGGSRVVVYPPAIGSNAVAIRILGLDAMATTGNPTQISVNGPLGLTATTAGVIVADTSNNRLLVFPTVDTWPAESTQFSPSATAVVGQTSYTVRKANQGNGDASASSVNLPVDVVASGSELFVADAGNNRVLVFSTTPSGVSNAASRVIGQLDFPYTATNLIEGREFSIAPVGNSASGSAILDQSATPAHLYVADTQNNRILGFSNFTGLQNGQKADLVIGQPDLFRSQINYPAGDATKPNAQGLNSPTSLAVDSAGNLYVTDTGNSRILRFPSPFASGKTALETADLVIGQSGFSSTVTDPSDRTMSAPISIALTADAANASITNSGWLIAADAVHNRVLFFPKPFSIGMSATKVLGSLNFTSVITQASSDPPRFNSPRSVAVDPQDRVIVADTGNHRVQIFNKAAAINNYDTPPISLNTQFNTPLAVTSNALGFWVADSAQNSLIHFPSIDQLPLKNNASDTSLPAVAPLSGYLDNYGNLLVGDSANRILYFGPQLDVVNAANYLTRPLAAGTIAAVFPHTNTGQSLPTVIANGTGSALASPLPTMLSDTQFLVGGNPAPLFFVSPGQINAVLSNSLSTGGTVDVLAIRPSTGQIYGGAEVQLASASPGFFTINQAGTGQIIAANLVDNSLNTAQNPVARGQFLTLYGTGVGPVPNAPPDGSAPTGATPAATNPQVLLGNSKTFLPDANIQYSGLNPSLVGVWQLNILIPTDAQTGTVPIKIFMNSIQNTDPNSTATTTIAIK